MIQRAARVGRTMQQALAALLERGAVKDPRVADAGMITVTEVRLTADLCHARVYVSILPRLRPSPEHGSQAADSVRAAAVDGLRHAAGYLRRELGRELGLRAFPELSFHLDESAERGARIEGILRELKRE